MVPPLSPSERHRRIRRIKRLLRPLPRRTNVHRYPVLKWFGEAARKRAYLWSFRLGAMTPAFYFGSILSLLPLIGVQLPLAFLGALLLRANLPVFAGLQMITNVFTAAPIYLFTYRVGLWFMELIGMHSPANAYGRGASATALGGIVCGLILGCILDCTYRFLAYEAGKHHWHLPRRKGAAAKESASTDDTRGHNV